MMVTHALKVYWRKRLLSETSLNSRKFLSNDAATSDGEEVMISRLQMAPSARALLAAVQRHLPRLNHTHLLQAFRTLVALPGDVVHDAAHDPAFDALCEAFATRARGLDADQLVVAARTLDRLGVSPESPATRATLQLLRCHLDKLDVHQIVKLERPVARLGATSHLGKALLTALPLAFRVRLPLEFDADEPCHLCEVFMYACRRAPTPAALERLVNALLAHRKTLDVRAARIILTALSEINCAEDLHPERTRLLRVCCDLLAQNLPTLEYKEVARVATAVRRRLGAAHVEYYHEPLLDAIGTYAATTSGDLLCTLQLARTLSIAGHAHRGLALRLCDLTGAAPSMLATMPFAELLALVDCVVDAEVKPAQEVLVHIARSAAAKATDELAWDGLCAGLMVLGYRDEVLVQRVLSSTSLERIERLPQRAQPAALWRLAALGARVQAPSHTLAPLVLQELTRALGGPNLVAVNVQLVNGVLADGVVCVSAGRAVAVDESGAPLYQMPSDALRVCVLVPPDECFTRNGGLARATARLAAAAAAADGRAALLVEARTWARAPSRERGPLLVRALRDVCASRGVTLLPV